MENRQEKNHPFPPARLLRKRSLSYSTIVTFSTASFIVLLFGLYFLFSGLGEFNHRGKQHIKQPSWSRDTQEYVLSPSWNINALPQKRYYNWTLSEISGNPDGVWRTLLAINGQFPGPLIEVNEGDTLVIDVYNRLTNSTSLHWHGFRQQGTNFMDGAVGVTNCPIPPGSSFRYEFRADDLRGTYWYHAHFSTTRLDGLFGPVVVHSPKEKIGLEYESDRVVMVQDYYHDLSASLLPKYLSPTNEKAEPIPNGALINGKGIANCSNVEKRYLCDPSRSGLEVLDLDKHKAHRLRFINVGAFAEFDIELDEHEVSLVEADGVEVVPHTINRFRINVAQRYSVIVPANHPAGESFWLRARMLVHCFAEIPATLEAEVKAIINYVTPTSPWLPAVPETKAWSDSPDLNCKDMNLTLVVPLHAIDAPKTADILIPVRSSFDVGAYQISRGFINGTSWRPSVKPTLLEAIEELNSNNRFFTEPQNDALLGAYDTSRQLVFKLEEKKVVDLYINNFYGGDHSFHLHGHQFWVLSQGSGHLDMDYYDAISTKNPLRRDTVTIEAYGWALVRFVADNPGMWAMHCHLAWHMEAGMLMQFLVGAETVKGWAVPGQVGEMCQDPERQRGGPMRDEDFFWR